MDVIDQKWILARLTNERGEKARLAQHIGLRPDQVSKVIKGERALKPHEIPKVMSFFDKAPPNEKPTGFSESQATPYEASSHRKMSLIETLCPKARHPSLFTVNTAAPWLGYLAGDILVIDMGVKVEDGDKVLATVANPETGESTTIISRYLGPWLSSGAPDEAPLKMDDSQAVAILGVIKASARTS